MFVTLIFFKLKTKIKVVLVFFFNLSIKIKFVEKKYLDIKLTSLINLSVHKLEDIPISFSPFFLSTQHTNLSNQIGGKQGEDSSLKFIKLLNSL